MEFLKTTPLPMSNGHHTNEKEKNYSGTEQASALPGIIRFVPRFHDCGPLAGICEPPFCEPSGNEVSAGSEVVGFWPSRLPAPAGLARVQCEHRPSPRPCQT